MPGWRNSRAILPISSFCRNARRPERCHSMDAFSPAASTEQRASRSRRLRDDMSLGLVSAYHAFHGVEHGREAHPTYYHLGKLHDPWHIDFCFVPASWASQIKTVHVGGPDEMITSDHRPVLVELSVG